jgi:hypothetical protein
MLCRARRRKPIFLRALLEKSKFYFCRKAVQPHDVNNSTTKYARYAVSGHQKPISPQASPNLSTRRTQAILHGDKPIENLGVCCFKEQASVSVENIK